MGDVAISEAELARLRRIETAARRVKQEAWTDRFSRLHGHPAVEALSVALERGSCEEGITDPATFERWWRSRDLSGDRELVRQAEIAGLVRSAGHVLFLTPEGKRLRREGEILRGAAVGSAP
jgi:hypothetical protein